MNFQGDFMTMGEKAIHDLRFYIRRRARDTAKWKDMSIEKKWNLKHKWAVEFFKERGVIDAAVRKAEPVEVKSGSDKTGGGE